MIADYACQDSHQVDLKASEIVHVIEKHDTDTKVTCVLKQCVMYVLHSEWKEYILRGNHS